MIRLKPTLTCVLIIYLIDMIRGFDLAELDDIGDRPQHEDSIIGNKLFLLVKRLIPDNYKTGQFDHDKTKPSQFEYNRKKPLPFEYYKKKPLQFEYYEKGPPQFEYYRKKPLQFEYYGKSPPQFEYYRKKPLRNPILSTNKESLTKKIISRGKIPQSEYDINHVKPVISTNEVSLVKRLVPKEYKTPQFEYDRKLKSVFVPKYRVHRQVPVNNGKVFTELYELFFKPMFVRNPGKSKMARQINRDILRANYEYDPEGTQYKRPQWVKVGDDKKDKQFNFPHFSLYNYWTYDKALLHDLCPPHQAQLGHHCIYAPMSSIS